MYYERFLESLTIAEIVIHEEAIKTYTIHPEDLINNKEIVLQEVSFSKEKMESFKQKTVQVFEQLVKKFMQMAFELKKKNTKWFESVKNFDISKKNLKDFSHEMYNYKEGVKRIEEFTLPVFNENLNKNDLSGNGEVFIQNICKKYNIETKSADGDGSSDITKDYFRGGSEKIVIKGNEVDALFKFAYNWLHNYESTARTINEQSTTINNVKKTKKQVTVTESTVLSESIFKDEYYDILLEDGVEPTDIKKEEKEGLNIDSNETKENKENMDHNAAIDSYWKICTRIQTMKMDVAQEAYKAFVDFIDKVMKY